MFNENSVVGPSSDERDPMRMLPQDIRLAGNDPLYYAFIDGVEDMASLDSGLVIKAKARLNDLAERYPDELAAYAGMPLAQAAAGLHDLERRLHESN